MRSVAAPSRQRNKDRSFCLLLRCLRRWSRRQRIGCGAIDVLAFGRHFSITQITNHLEDFAPCGKRAVVKALVLINGHDKLKEFITHLPFFSLSSQIAPSSPRSASSLQAGATIHHGSPLALPPFNPGILLSHGLSRYHRQAFRDQESSSSSSISSSSRSSSNSSSKSSSSSSS